MYIFAFLLLGILVSWAFGSLVMVYIFCGLLVAILLYGIIKRRIKNKDEGNDLKEEAKVAETAKCSPSKPEEPNKIPVDLDLIKYVPEEKLSEVVNSLALKYGISAAVIWAAIHEARKDVALVVNTEDKVYREDFFGDDRNRDVYLNDYEPDEMDADEMDEVWDDLDEFERQELLDKLDDDEREEFLIDHDLYSPDDDDDDFSSNGSSDSWEDHGSYDDHDSWDDHGGSDDHDW